jgi:hypothetical protein
MLNFGKGHSNIQNGNNTKRHKWDLMIRNLLRRNKAGGPGPRLIQDLE